MNLRDESPASLCSVALMDKDVLRSNTERGVEILVCCN